jgi:hypothetical protein
VSVTGGHKYWNGADEMQNVMAPVLPKSLRLQGRKELRRFRSLGGWTYACDDLFDYFRVKDENISNKDADKFKHAIRRVIDMYGYNDRESRFIDKSQSYSLKVSYINEILKTSNPFFLLITRNPYAVCQRAVMKTNLSKVSVTKEKKINMAVSHWGNTMKSVFEDSRKVENIRNFKIEDVIKCKSEEVREICNFLDIDFNYNMMPSNDDKMPITGLRDDKWYPIKESINRRYMDKLETSIQRKLNERYSGIIERLDYEVVT